MLDIESVNADVPQGGEEQEEDQAQQEQQHLHQKQQEQLLVLGHRALIGFCTCLVVLIIVDSIVGRTVDWVMQIMCIVMTLSVMSQTMTLLASSLVSFHLGLLGMLSRLDSTYDPLGILWLIVCIPLWLLSVAIGGAVLYFGGRSEFIKADAWLPPLSFCGRRARKEVRGCACGLCCLLLLLVIAAIILIAITENLCSVARYDASWVQPAEAISRGLMPAMEIGTRENMNVSAPIDLTGLWWIRWTHGDPIPMYSKLHVEELVSFAGTDSNVTAAPFYPLQLRIPNRFSGHWGYSNTLVGRVGMSLDSEKEPADHRMIFDFSNRTHANLPGADPPTLWYFDYIDSDQWLRTMVRQDAEDWFYTLQRIIFEDGTPHPVYFPDFVKHMEGTKLGVYTTDNHCMRMCGSRPFGSCMHCEQQCGT